MIIDYTFFQDGLLCIEGISLNDITPSQTNTSITNMLNACIEKYEEDYMVSLLGEKLYEEYSVHKDEDRWKNLENILVNKSGKYPRSPIANYVYFYFLRNNDSQATITGVKKDNDDGKIISPERKMIFAWNDMVKQNEKVVLFLINHESEYNGWDGDNNLLIPINLFGL